MGKHAELSYQHNTFVVSGDLDFKNVLSLHQQLLEKSGQAPDLIFDFSRVTTSDSSGLALVIEWIRLANQTNKKIAFKGLSNGLLELAQVSGLDAVINPLIKTS